MRSQFRRKPLIASAVLAGALSALAIASSARAAENLADKYDASRQYSNGWQRVCDNYEAVPSRDLQPNATPSFVGMPQDVMRARCDQYLRAQDTFRRENQFGKSTR